MVQEQVDTGIQLTADFPSLRGDPGSAFSYTLTITNNTPAEQTFTFNPRGPQGWEWISIGLPRGAIGTSTPVSSPLPTPKPGS